MGITCKGCEHLDVLGLLMLSYSCVAYLWDRKAGIKATQQLESLHVPDLGTLLSLFAWAEFGKFPHAVHWQRQIDDLKSCIASLH